MFRLPVRLGIAGLAAALVLGQETTPTFRAGARLVELTVSVLDRKGGAVADLTAQDFTILDAGAPRQVAFFRFEGGADASQPRPALPKGAFTNNVELVGGAPRNITALVLDGLNTPAQYNMQARAQVMRYLKALPPDSRVAVFHMGRQLRVLHDFTDDAAALRERIEKARLEIPLESVTDFSQTVIEAEQLADLFAGEPGMIELLKFQMEMEMAANAAARRSRLERTLVAMESLGRHLEGVPGRKNLVWITGGVSMIAILGEMGMGPHGGVEHYDDQVRAVSRSLAQRGVALYIVDAHGLETQRDLSASFARPLPVRGRGRFESQADAEQMNNDPYPAGTLMASITGGRYLHNTNDLTSGFKQAVADLRGSYTLGFYAPEAVAEKWRKLKVRVARPGVTVRHREGYFPESGQAEQPQWTADSWRAAASSPLGSSAVPLLVSCRPIQGGEWLVSIRVSAGALQFREEKGTMRADLQLLFAGRSPDQTVHPTYSEVGVVLPRERLAHLKDSNAPILRRWKPAPSVNHLRIVVRDKHSGQYGTVDVPLEKAR